MITTTLLYAITSFLLFFYITKLSYKIGAIDIPNDRRKVHKHATAYTGGVILSIILLISLKIFNLSDLKLTNIISMSFLISLIGLLDDKYDISVSAKLSLQIIPIFYLLIFQELILRNLGDYFFFSLNLESFSIPFTLLSILLLVNSFNYFDGLDGTLIISILSTLLILYFMIGDEEIKLFIFIILIPIFIFLCFNFKIFKLPKLFLGDSGSLLLGFIISFLLIFIASEKLLHPILIAWSIAIFVFEFLSINIIRIKDKKNIFTPNLDHLHHILFKKTNSIILTNLSIFCMNLSFFLTGFLLFNYINSLVSLVAFILFFFTYFFCRMLFKS